MLTILVGPNDAEFYIPRAQLCQRSPMFAVLYAKPSNKRPYRIVEGKIEVHRQLVRFLKTSRVPAAPDNVKRSSKEAKAFSVSMIELYRHAVAYDMRDLQNKVLDRLGEHHQNCRGSRFSKTIETAYRKSMNGSKLRWYYAMGAACYLATAKKSRKDRLRRGKILELKETLPHFKADMARIHTKHHTKIEVRKLDHRYATDFDQCEYHFHKPNDICHRLVPLPPLPDVHLGGQETIDLENIDSESNGEVEENDSEEDSSEDECDDEDDEPEDSDENLEMDDMVYDIINPADLGSQSSPRNSPPLSEIIFEADDRDREQSPSPESVHEVDSQNPSWFYDLRGDRRALNELLASQTLPHNPPRFFPPSAGSVIDPVFFSGNTQDDPMEIDDPAEEEREDSPLLGAGHAPGQPAQSVPQPSYVNVHPNRLAGIIAAASQAYSSAYSPS